jgi:hypothetical protein
VIAVAIRPAHCQRWDRRSRRRGGMVVEGEHLDPGGEFAGQGNEFEVPLGGPAVCL